MFSVSSVVCADGFEVGLHIQQANVDQINHNQKDGRAGLQGTNIVVGGNKGVWQTTESEDIKMKQDGGRDSVQCVNCLKTDSGISGSYQSVDADEASLTQIGGENNIQGLNVVVSE